jgi:hypothetical protein
MTALVGTAIQKKAVNRTTEPTDQTLEEELFTLHTLTPGLVEKIPSLFSESVVTSVMGILGENPGEALIRGIGDESLVDPTEAYERLDSLLQGGSEILKAAIREEFRVKVHRLYKMTMDMALPRFQTR